MVGVGTVTPHITPSPVVPTAGLEFYGENAYIMGMSKPRSRTIKEPKHKGSVPRAKVREIVKATKKAKEPDLVEVLDLTSEPFSTLISAGQDCGLDPGQMSRLLSRVRAKYQPVLSELKTVKAGELVNLLEDRAYRALEYLDDFALAKSSAKDLAIVAGIMLEKRQLLKGEPTHILSTTERMSMSELVPLLVQEAEKRGLTLLNEGDMVDITPAEPERAARPRVRVRGADINKRERVKQKAESGEP